MRIVTPRSRCAAKYADCVSSNARCCSNGDPAPPAHQGAKDIAAATAPPAEASEVVLDYCSAVRGILNDDQGGPLQPPGLRMAEALGDVRASLQRNLEANRGGALR